MAKRETKKEGEVREYLDLVGQDDDEKAVPFVIETEREAEKEQKGKEERVLQFLSEERKTKFDYLKGMVDLFNKRCQQVDWPKGWKWEVGIKGTDKLHLLFKAPNGNVYGKGIKVTGMPFYDLNALHTLATQAENTVDEVTGPSKTPGGIYLK